LLSSRRAAAEQLTAAQPPDATAAEIAARVPKD